MQPFIQFESLVAPLDRANVDTDAIIPKQYLKSVKRTGFGPNLFDDWRYLDSGEPGQDNSIRRINPEFILNQPQYAQAGILLARKNFGCGSSREHAVWALMDYGIRVVIAPSFADIFYNNSFKNGLLPIALIEVKMDYLFDQEAAASGYRLKVDLEAQMVIATDGTGFGFTIDAFRKHCLLNGLDEIGLTLQHVDAIRQYESRRRKHVPWLFDSSIQG